MKIKLYLLLAGLTLSCLLPARAQDSSRCNANFGTVVSGTTVYFHAVDSLDSTITHYWSFGDTSGLISTSGAYIIHAYAHGGTYRVLHIVKGPHCYDSVSKLVVIDTIPAVTCYIDVYALRDSTRGNHYYNLYAYPYTSAGTVDSVFWFVNDSLIGIGQNLPGRYFVNGSYRVCARMISTQGCTVQNCTQLVVTDSIPVDTIPNPPPPPPACQLVIQVKRDSSQANKFTFSVTDSATHFDSVQWYSYRSPDSAYKTSFAGSSWTAIFPDTGCYVIYVSTLMHDSLHCFASTIVCIDSIAAPVDSVSALNRNSSIAAYPNPVYSQTIVDLTLDKEEKVMISIFNSMGNLVQTNIVAGSKGFNHLTIPTGSLTTGIYYIQVRYGDTTKRSKIQKL